MMSTCALKHVKTRNKLIVKQKFCASSWLITEVNILRCTVSETSKIIQGGVLRRNKPILIKIQPDATACSLIYFTANSLYMFRVSQHPSSGVIKTATAASGIGHNIGTATSLQRGQDGTLVVSSCTDIMTCTGGCGYGVWYCNAVRRPS